MWTPGEAPPRQRGEQGKGPKPGTHLPLGEERVELRGKGEAGLPGVFVGKWRELASPGSRPWEDGGQKISRKCSCDQHLGKGKKGKGGGGEV